MMSALFHKPPPRAIPVLPSPPTAQAIPAKLPPRALPVALPASAGSGPAHESPRRALAVKLPTAPVIPTLPAVPPPRAIAVLPLPAPVIPTLPAVPPPRAVAVAPPAPAPIPEVVSPAPAPPTIIPMAAITAGSSPDDGSGETRFPRPNYPYAARSAGQSGTVLMNVQFDSRGTVVSAEVAQSSGVPVLDSATRDFILRHWRLPAYAGKIVSVPIEYKLESR
jgi:protein TonB